ncbi:MAG: serine/threonine-protein kinase [Pseudomonadota bacterium]
MQRYCPKCFERFEQDLTRCPDDGEKLVLVAEQDLVGHLLDDRYKILSKLGEGGMGTVYVAEQAMIGRKVALKVLRGAAVQDESSVKRFLTEAKAIASLRSPHTVTLHDFGVTTEGLLYYTMELLEGAPLSKVIKDEAPMDWARSAHLLLQACKSLEEAHDKGILHRDIKPDNLFVTRGIDGEHITVLDFGIAKLADGTVGTITKTGMICGTPAYLSPEQAQGYEARKASDLYSLGVVFYEMLAGEPPFSDTTAMRVLMKHVGEEAKPVSVKNPKVQVPESIDQFVRHVLQKNPADRHQDVPEFRRSLQEALRAAAMEGTVSLPALGTSANGLREITTDFRDLAPGNTPMTVDPMASTMETPSGELDAVQLSTGETLATDPVKVRPPPAPLPSFIDDDFPGTDTAALARETRRRGPLWVGLGVLVVLAGVLGVWRPWEGLTEQPAAPVAAAEGPSEPSPSPAPTAAISDVVEVTPPNLTSAPDVTNAPPVAVVSPPGPDVVDVTTTEDITVASAPAPDAGAADVAPPPPSPEAAAAAAAAATAAATVAAEASAKTTEDDQLAEETRRADEVRRADDERKKRRTEMRAAEKKAMEAAAAQKAAAAAEAQKAAAAAAAKKAAEVAETPSLGFRKVTVEDKPADKPDSGLGFRKVKVEEK